MHYSTFLISLAAASLANGYALKDSPKLQAIYNKYNKAGATCSKVVRDGFKDKDKSDVYRYCNDFHNDVLFLHRKGGLLNDMDIDCDGTTNGTLDCSQDLDGQKETKYGWQVKEKLGGPVAELNAQLHPYVVFGNSGSNPSFDPEDWGMHGLSVMAVVCNNQVHYGVWADTNEGTSTGEASLALAKLCFPQEGLNGNKGHDANDVLYVAFAVEDDAVPSMSNSLVPANADWKAKDTATFENSIKKLGDRLYDLYIPQL